MYTGRCLLSVFFESRRCKINKKYDRRPPANKDTTELNEDIRDAKVRLIGPDGEQIGVVSSDEALNIARDKNLDLVKIVEKAKPPVCKIMDYGKFKYEKQKKEKEMKKKQKVISVKEVRLSVNIEQHDLETKARNAIRFLKAGDKVKVALRMWGRQLANPQIGLEVVKEFIDYINEIEAIVVEQRPKLDNRNVTAVINKE